MWSSYGARHFICFCLMAWIAGCGTQTGEMNQRQADIGFGIVEGTKGYRQLQKEGLGFTGSMRRVQGQVLSIEGAAYVVQMNDRIDVRLPVDENTRIDRPAHVGDWIEAQLDESGRARTIRNIDEQIFLEGNQE
jgi:hypothetical protein